MGEDLRGELALPPIGAWVFMVSEDGDALGFESGKEIWRVAFPVKDQREAVAQRVGGQLLGRGLSGDLGQQARHDLFLLSLIHI